jgi:hypothetical protein
MRRTLFWVGALVGALLLAGGVVVTAHGVAAHDSPAGVVRGYFTALADSDAARALAYGDVPSGPRTLLTDEVLSEQQRIAAFRDVSVRETQRHGSTATVHATYALAFADARVPVATDVALHKSGGDWRMDSVAVRVELLPGAARQRESILGGRLPTGSMLLFPGALPIRLDTPYLRLDAYKDNVTFHDLSDARIYLHVSDAGYAAMVDAVRAALRRCLTGPRDPACPLPNERYVPGSIRGTLKGGLRAASVVVETLEPVGTLRFSGSATIAGSWQRLDFHNRRVTGRGRIDLDIHAVAYATQPLRLRWEAT